MVEQKTSILDLPIELRDSIVDHLDVKDILSLSLTCKLFHVIWESRQRWVKLAQELQLQPQISRMEEPLEDFTTQELRDWILRRHKIRHCLDSGSRAVGHHIRGVSGGRKNVSLPGGRWLLFESYPGTIAYADCDAPRPEVKLLITLEDIALGHNTQVVWRDPDSPRLTYRVAFLYWYYREDEMRDYWAHFYKIDLIGHGSSAELVAERIHLYQGIIARIETSGEAIRGEYFYQIHHLPATVSSTPHVTLKILNYGNGSSVAQQLRLVDFYDCLYRWRLDVLPDGRIVVSGASGVVIYPNPLSAIGGEMRTLSPLLAIRSLGCSLHNEPVNVSKWYSSLNSNMAVYGAPGKRMKAVLVPHDGGQLMERTIGKLVPNDTARCARVGLFHSVSMNSRDRMSIWLHPWGDFEDQTGSIGMTRRIFTIEREQDDGGDGLQYGRGYSGERDAWDVVYFSEELGRAIMADPMCGYFVVDIVV